MCCRVTSGGRIPRRADLWDATAPDRCMWHSRWTFGLRGLDTKLARSPKHPPRHEAVGLCALFRAGIAAIAA